MGAAASSQSLPNNQSWNDTAINSGSRPISTPGGGQSSAMACGFSDFSLYPDRFSLTERRQTIGGFPARSLSSSTSSSSSSSSSSSTSWSRVRSTTICGETVDLSGGSCPTARGAAGNNWRGEERRRHHSSGSGKQQPSYGGPFSDFNLYPDRYHFLKEDHR